MDETFDEYIIHYIISSYGNSAEQLGTGVRDKRFRLVFQGLLFVASKMGRTEDKQVQCH